jgi:probable rRNA maturation factor|tara:strand:+ start:242 stop:706 length:465 start_codon:yes stop_codon:yes gene_type:complete
MIKYTISCKSNHWPTRLKQVKKIIDNILKSKKYLKFKNNIDYECNIILGNNILLKQINFQYRKKNKTTDVLTFVSNLNLNKKKKKYCDIFISAEVLKNDAKKNKISFYDHFAHILIHSFLHINGFVHKKIDDFNKMKSIEILILKKNGISNPYI